MDIQVRTECGVLCGEKKDGYSQFLGVPYAKPPIGELRFRRPEPMDHWDGVRMAKQFTSYCIQPGKPERIDSRIGESEDCLTLNIFIPACDNKKRPVVDGDPNGNGEPFWKECGTEKNTMFLDVECHMEKNPFEKERQTYGALRIYGN